MDAMKIGLPIIIVAAVSVISLGCEGEIGPGPSGGGGQSQSGGSNSGGGNTGGGGGSNDVGGFSPGGSGGRGQGGADACAGVSVKAELVPLDMYILLDKSGSMADAAGKGPGALTKWEAVTAALEAFFVDPQSAGIGVGLQFFPIIVPNVPDTCTNSAQCGAAAPCFLHACEEQLLLGNVVPCDVDAECGAGDSCAPLGVCSANAGYVCLYQTPEVSCGSGLGQCVEITQSFCVNEDSCLAGDYAAPAVEIQDVASGAQSLLGAIAAQDPEGATPTAPALAGAIQHAREWAAANPGRKVVAVLATDGLPTECQPQEIGPIADIAEQGADGSPSVLTFVIGVFGQGDLGAQPNLDMIADGGGTSSAFFITDAQDVTQAFVDALKAIQVQTLACEYKLPAAPDGSELDYALVNVQHTPGSETAGKTVYYVGSAQGCDAAMGGWYYDADPAKGEAPTKIVMCPTTCAALETLGGEVDIEMGCQTIVPEPK